MGNFKNEKTTEKTKKTYATIDLQAKKKTNRQQQKERYIVTISIKILFFYFSFVYQNFIGTISISNNWQPII